MKYDKHLGVVFIKKIARSIIVSYYTANTITNKK